METFNKFLKDECTIEELKKHYEEFDASWYSKAIIPKINPYLTSPLNTNEVGDMVKAHHLLHTTILIVRNIFFIKPSKIIDDITDKMNFINMNSVFEKDEGVGHKLYEASFRIIDLFMWYVTLTYPGNEKSFETFEEHYQKLFRHNISRKLELQLCAEGFKIFLSFLESNLPNLLKDEDFIKALEILNCPVDERKILNVS